MAAVMVRGHSIDVDQVAHVEEFYCAAGGGYATIAFSGGTEKTIKWGGKENELAKTEFHALVENMEARAVQQPTNSHGHLSPSLRQTGVKSCPSSEARNLRPKCFV